GSTMKETNINSFISYTLFWLTFTISRFLVNNLSSLIENLVRINSLILLFLVTIFVLTKNPILFSLSGFFFGPIFPYVQSKGIKSINGIYVPLFNGSTYAFTSLGGNIVSTLMGLTLDKSAPLSWSIPAIIIFTIYSISKKL
ncbi:MAG: MFS transporter, partial [Fervidobacterium sp.]